jgi:SMC interacting uncharacterized protein involved in chromosome segregation
MTKDDRGDLDLTKQIEIKNKEIKTLNDVVINLKNILDSKEAEITARTNVSESHQQLNGELRKELDEVKADNKKLAKEITDLKKEAKEMLRYP